MPVPRHVALLDKKITALSKALANLGKGTDLRELLRIIRNPGWTTPAELAFTVAILDSIDGQLKQLAKLQKSLVVAGKRVKAAR